MEIYCSELEKSFADKRDLFQALKASKDDIIRIKKMQVKSSQGIALAFKPDVAVKEDLQPKQLEIGDTVKVAMNTTNYMDYDHDVLIDGAWNKSAREQNGKTYHVADHKLEMGKIVAYPKDVEIAVEEVAWSKLGKDFMGSTQVLVFKSKMTEKTNKDVFMAYRDGESIEHSIRLMYISMKLALNSNEPRDKEEKAVWDTYYSKVANKEDADEAGYFWAVTEARIYKEGSTVLFGANDATPQLKDLNEPELSTHTDEPDQSTQKHDNEPPNEKGTQTNIYEFLIKNLKN